MSKVDGLIVAIFLVLILDFIVWGFYFGYENTQKMTQAGCIPTTWDRFGIGHYFRCRQMRG